MQLSRPVSVMILMGVMVAVAAWYAPPRHEAARVAVMLPSDVYRLLSQKGEAEVGATGRPRSVAQVIEGYARK